MRYMDPPSWSSSSSWSSSEEETTTVIPCSSLKDISSSTSNRVCNPSQPSFAGSSYYYFSSSSCQGSDRFQSTSSGYSSEQDFGDREETVYSSYCLTDCCKIFSSSSLFSFARPPLPFSFHTTTLHCQSPLPLSESSLSSSSSSSSKKKTTTSLTRLLYSPSSTQLFTGIREGDESDDEGLENLDDDVSDDNDAFSPWFCCRSNKGHTTAGRDQQMDVVVVVQTDGNHHVEDTTTEKLLPVELDQLEQSSNTTRNTNSSSRRGFCPSRCKRWSEILYPLLAFFTLCVGIASLIINSNLNTSNPVLFLYLVLTLTSEIILVCVVSSFLCIIRILGGEVSSIHANAMCGIVLKVLEGLFYYVAGGMGIYILCTTHPASLHNKLIDTVLSKVWEDLTRSQLTGGSSSEIRAAAAAAAAAAPAMGASSASSGHLAVPFSAYLYVSLEVFLSLLFTYSSLPVILGGIKWLGWKIWMKVFRLPEVDFQQPGLPVNYCSIELYRQQLPLMSNPLRPLENQHGESQRKDQGERPQVELIST